MVHQMKMHSPKTFLPRIPRDSKIELGMNHVIKFEAVGMIL